MASALRVLFEKLRRVADGQNGFRGIVGNFTTEFFFKRHHELDGVETVGAEVVNEARTVDHFVGLNTKVFDHDLLNPLANLTHRSTSCLFHWSRPQRHPQDIPKTIEPSWSFSFLRNCADSARSCPWARRTSAGFAPPIYMVSNSCKAFFAHPIAPFGYHTSK